MPQKAACHGGLWACCGVTKYSSLQRAALEKHERSDAHTTASKHGDSTQALLRTPSQEDFQELAKHLSKASVGETGLDQVGGHKKCRKMIWCLAEAHRAFKRKLWVSKQGADGQPAIVSTTLFQDARKGKLTVRFSGASSSLQRLEGHLGTVDLTSEFSADAVGLMQATMFVVSSFCVPNFVPPYCDNPGRLPESKLNETLERNLVESIETFVSDAAADEIRAGHMLAGQTTSSTYRPGFKNLKLVVRDRPHATRRNLSRGWKADPVLDEIVNKFILDPGSPTRLIQYSSQFQQMFASNIRQTDPSLSAVKIHGFVKDLGFAAHRFESMQKPLSRIVLFFHAFLSTLVQIAWQRKNSDEGRSCIDFIEWLTLEKCVLVAMLADAGEENLQLTRLVDYQGFPVDELSFHLGAFLVRVRQLFTGDAPLCLTTGFTAHMLKILKSDYCMNLPSGRQSRCKQLGSSSGVGAGVINTGLVHMGAWVRLTEGTIEAEFPSYHVQNAFSCFNVNGQNVCRENVVIRQSSQLSKLCRAFSLPDQPAAAAQLEKFRHVAAQVAKDEGVSSAEAWIEAIRRITRSWKKADVGALLPLLVRFWAAGASTSGVEQSFSQAEAASKFLQLPGHLNDVMEVACCRRNGFNFKCSKLVTLHTYDLC